MWSVKIGGEYDLTVGTLSYGPLLCAEYNYVHNRGFTEKDADAAPLKVKGSNADSQLLSVGAHLYKMWLPTPTVVIGADLRAGVRHEFLDNNFRTRATFNDYGAYSFESYTKGAGRNSFYLQSELKILNSKSGIFGSLTLGYEHHKNADIYNVWVKAGWRF